MQFNKKYILLLETLIKWEKKIFFYNSDWSDAKSVFAVRKCYFYPTKWG